MCVGGLLRVGAEGLKLGFLNPQQPRRHLQERTPQMVFSPCICVCTRTRVHVRACACKREVGSN